MFAEIKFMNGLDPTNVKERELAIAEKKSHSAKVAHKRRRDKQEALSLLRTPWTRPESRSTIYTSDNTAAKGSHGSTEPIWSSLSTKNKSVANESSHDQEDNKLTDVQRIRHSTVKGKPISTNFIPRQPHSSVYLAFDGDRWMPAFQFYVNVSGPLIANSHSYYGREIYTRIFPQMAVSSSVVRHMLLAYACFHNQLPHTHHSDKSIPNSQSLYHYSRGLEIMRTESDELEFLAAATLGYIFEVIQNNLHSAIMHLKGYRAIVYGYTGSKNEAFLEMTADHEFTLKLLSTIGQKAIAMRKQITTLPISVVGSPPVSQDHKATVSDKGSPQEQVPSTLEADPPLQALNRARDTLASIMAEIGSSFPLSDTAKRRAIESQLDEWIHGLVKCEIELGRSASAMVFLFVLAAASLPENYARRISRLIRTSLHDYVHREVKHRVTIHPEDILKILRTMEASAKHATEYLRLPEYQRRLKLILDFVEHCEPGHALYRPWVAAKHVFFHVMCEEALRTTKNNSQGPSVYHRSRKR